MANQEFQITLPREMADEVERKVSSGAYSSASEVVQAGIRTLLDREIALEDWLRTEVVAGHQEYLDNPSDVVPASEILDRIKSRRAGQK